jgi:hypothetical protein
LSSTSIDIDIDIDIQRFDGRDSMVLPAKTLAPDKARSSHRHDDGLTWS